MFFFSIKCAIELCCVLCQWSAKRIGIFCLGDATKEEADAHTSYVFGLEKRTMRFGSTVRKTKDEKNNRSYS